jgi:DNA polymerase-3 subunit chi
MPRVDFYLVEHSGPEACLRTACRIIDKAYKQRHHLLVHCTDKNQAQGLDKLLWTFQDISFVPHVLWQQQSSIEAPIIICDQSQSLPAQSRDILVNLTADVPNFFSQFQRVVEVVSADTDARKLARERFRHYRNVNCELYSHQIK